METFCIFTETFCNFTENILHYYRKLAAKWKQGKLLLKKFHNFTGNILYYFTENILATLLETYCIITENILLLSKCTTPYYEMQNVSYLSEIFPLSKCI